MVDNNPYVVRSRFDSSDHSDDEEEAVNNVLIQQGHSLHSGVLEEGNGISAIHSPSAEEKGTSNSCDNSALKKLCRSSKNLH